MAGLALTFNCPCARSQAASSLAAPERTAPLSPVDRFNYAVGTQTIGAAYQFSEKPRLLETALVIQEMGASVIKFSLDWARDRGPRPENLKTLRDVAAEDPVVKAIFAMPFAHYILWTYPLGKGRRQALSGEGRDEEIFDLCCHLLQTYNGTGKTFYLGHWEGDWELRGRAGSQEDPSPEAVAQKIGWFQARQKAVDDSKREVPHQEVEIFCYAEANMVRDAMKGRRTIVNDVIGPANVDYVSYSSYDVTNERTSDLPEALDYIASKLPAKPSIPGRRVWVGEYGYPAERFSPAEQDCRSREVIKAALKWGCPFALYWELYNNEVEKSGRQRGFWMIDDKGAKQPVFHTHQRLCRRGREYVAKEIAAKGSPPAFSDYTRAALEWLG
jgi:hypothetical protein